MYCEYKNIIKIRIKWILVSSTALKSRKLKSSS